MKSITYSAFRGQLSSVLDSVNENHAPVMITRQSGASAVVLSLEDFNSYEETAHLMSSVNNAVRLNEAIEQLESGKGTERELFEE